MFDAEVKDIEGRRCALMLAKRYGGLINKHVLTENDNLLFRQVERYVIKMAERGPKMIAQQGECGGKKITCF